MDQESLPASAAFKTTTGEEANSQSKAVVKRRSFLKGLGVAGAALSWLAY
jgi:hypothetical protein